MSADIAHKGRLYHNTPGWVPEGETFHIRIRCGLAQKIPFTDAGLARLLLASVRYYHTHNRWSCRVFLLMPDHLHALLVFPRAKAMSQVIKEWKSYHTRQHQVTWQDGYFDHRIRHRAELEQKDAYIRQNPVVKGLITQAADWRWIVDRTSLGDG